MAAITDCPTCGYPLSIEQPGKTRICEYCSTKLTAQVSGPVSQTVGIPSGLVWGLLGLTIGVIFGPSIIASTEAGSNWLAKKARERIS